MVKLFSVQTTQWLGLNLESVTHAVCLPSRLYTQLIYTQSGMTHVSMA